MQTLKELSRARAEEAARLRNAGWTWQEIADELRFGSANTPCNLVKRHGLDVGPPNQRMTRLARVRRSQTNAIGLPLALPEASAV